MTTAKEDLLALAEELCAGGEERHWRSSISRAYYSVYHGCNDWHATLLPGSNTGPAGGKHQQLVNKLRHPAPETKDPERQISRALSPRLDALRMLRIQADYLLHEDIDKVVSANACAKAKEALKLLPP